MAWTRINWKPIVVLMLAALVLGATAWGLHRWQRENRSSEGLTLGLEAYEQQNWSIAAQQLGRYLSVNPNDTEILLKYAQVHLRIRPLREGNIKQAVAAYRNVLRSAPGNADAAGELAQLYFQIGAASEAEFITAKALEDNPDPVVQRWHAFAQIQQGKYAEAVQSLLPLVEKHPDEVPAYELLGRMAEEQPTMIEQSPAYWYDKAVKNTGKAEAYLARAAFRLRQEDMAGAREDMAAAAQSLDTPSRLTLIRLYLQINDLDKARALLDSMDEDAKQEYNYWELRLAVAALESIEAAAEQAQAALEALPPTERWDFVPTAVELFIEAGKISLAEQYIAEFRQQDVMAAQVAYWQGLIATHQQEFSKAIDLFRQAAALGARNEDLPLVTAEALVKAGDPIGAAAELRKRLSDDHNDAEARLALAQVLLQVDDAAGAAEQAQVLVEGPEALAPAILVWAKARLVIMADASRIDPTELKTIETALQTLLPEKQWAASALQLLFTAALQNNDLELAAERLQALEKMQPDGKFALLAQAAMTEKRGEDEAAEKLLLQAHRLYPDAHEPLQRLAEYYRRKDQLDKAERVLRESMDETERPIEKRKRALLLADYYRKLDREAEALELLLAMASEQESDIPLRRTLLRYVSVQEDSELSQKLIDEIKLAEGEEGWQWRYEQARHWLNSDQATFEAKKLDAQKLLEENLMRNPGDQGSRLLLAEVYGRAEQYELAATTCRDALGRDPSNMEIQVLTIRALNRAGDYAGADQILGRIDRNQAQNPIVQALRLESHYRRGDLATVEKILEQQGTGHGEEIFGEGQQLALASVKLEQGKLDEAETLLNKLRQQQPDSPSVLLAAVNLSLLKGEGERALELCNEMLAKEETLSGYLLRARTQETLENWPEALSDLQKAADLAPESVQPLLVRAQICWRLDRRQEAIDALDNAIQRRGDDPEVLRRAISLYLSLPDPAMYNRGQELLAAALAKHPNDATFQYYQARLLIDQGNRPARDEARRLLRKIVDDSPTMISAWVQLGRLALSEGESRKAIDYAVGGLVHAPENQALLLLKARAEQEISPSMALPTLHMLLQHNPRNVDAALLMASVLVEQEKTEEATTVLQQTLERVESKEDRERLEMALITASYRAGQANEAWQKLDEMEAAGTDASVLELMRVRLLLLEGRFKEIVARARQWSENHPEDNSTVLRIADRLLHHSSAEPRPEALEVLDLVLDAHPNHLGALHRKAQWYQWAQQQRAAAQVFERILEIQPDDMLSTNNLAWILSEDMGEHERALQMVNRGLGRAPDYVDLIDTRGVIHFRLEKYDQAIADFERCLELYPEHVDGRAGSLYHLGRALIKSGQDGKGVARLKEALKHYQQYGAGLSSDDVTEIERLMSLAHSGTN